MARRVFFSFHYQDVVDFRANVVRNHWRFKLSRDAAGFFDASVWEKAKKDSDLALKRLINGAIQGTSRTAVLIGSQTHARRWVRYEIFRSIMASNHLIGVHINGIAGQDGRTKLKGPSPFDSLGLYFSPDGRTVSPCLWRNGRWEYDEDSAAFPSPWGDSGVKGTVQTLAQLGYPVYDWVTDKGYENFSSWVA